VGLSEFSRRQAALKQELVFALLAVHGLAFSILTPPKRVSLLKLTFNQNVTVKLANPAIEQSYRIHFRCPHNFANAKAEVQKS